MRRTPRPRRPRPAPAAPAGPPALRLESLEPRETPAGLIASVAGGTVTGYDPVTRAGRFSVTPFPGFGGTIGVAVGDVNGDGTADLLAAAGAGGGPVVRAFSGADGAALGDLLVGDPDSRRGATVAAADFDADGRADLVVGTSAGSRPLVQVLRFADRGVIRTLTPPFDADIGVSVAAADLTGDGVPDVVVGAGAGAGPRVTGFDGATGNVVFDQLVFEPTFAGGVQVAAGDLDGDGRADVVAAAGAGGGPRVSTFSGATGRLLSNFFAYDPGQRAGVGAAVTDTDGDGRAEVVTVGGPGVPADPRAFDPLTLASEQPPPGGGLSVGAGGDTVAPTGAVTSTAADPTAASPVPFTVTFSEPVNGFAADDVAVTGGAVTAGSFAAVDPRTYTLTVTPAGDGAVTVSAAAGAAADAAGNPSAAVAAGRRTFAAGAVAVTVDPLVTADTTPTVTGTTAAGAAVSVTVDGQTVAAAVTGTTWAATVPAPLAAGTYAVTATATLGGRTGTATRAGGLVVDVAPPTGVVTSSAPSPTNGPTIPFTVTFGEDVTGFEAGDVAVTGGTLTAGSFAANTPRTYAFTVTPAGDGPVTVSAAAGAAADTAGNPSAAVEALTRTSDRTAPAAAVGSSAGDRTNLAAIPFRVTFAEDVTGFEAADVTVTGGTLTAGSFTAVNARTFDLTVTPGGDGPVSVSAAAGAAADLAGNPSAAAVPVTRTSDRAAPVGAVSSTAGPVTNAAAIPFTVTFGEDVTGFEAGDVTVAGGAVTAGSFAATDARTYAFTVTPAGDGPVTVSAAAGAAADLAGNPSAAVPAATRTSDRTAPTAVVGSPEAASTDATAVTFTVTFAEDVTGFTGTTGGADADLEITNGTVVPGTFRQATPRIYLFAVTPTAAGPVTAEVRAGAAADAAGNPSPAATLSRTAITPAQTAPTSVPRDTGVLSPTSPPADAPEFVATPTGVRVWDVVAGTGPAVVPGAVVTIDYSGWLASNGAQFDSSRTRANPNTFDLDGLIDGWQVGIPGMRPGGIRRLYIPAALGYGAQGTQNIPPNADLVFEIRLLSSS